MARAVYEFEGVRVDLGRMAMTRDAASIPLEPKAFNVLVYLIEHRDRLVTKDELLDVVWAGTFVTPNVLTRAVAQIRKALGDETENARFIETAAKRGYRFIAPVTVVAPAATTPAPVVDQPSVTPLASEAVGHAAPRTAVRPRRPVAVAVAMAAVIASVGAILIFRPHVSTDRSSADLQLKRLTNRRGFSGSPALSPDGRAVVYASDATGGMELYLASLVQGGGEVPLTKDGGHNMQPAWSPDGQWIAFHSRRRGGVWIVPATGGTPQQVTDFGSDPAWSPGSDRLVFTSDAGGLAGQSSLWTVRPDGHDRRPLTAIGSPPGGHRAPVWSHDGRHVAFIVANGGWRADIRIVDVASGAQQRVDIGTNATDPAFTADDRALLWGGSTLTGNGRLFRHALAADGSPVGETEVVVPMDAGLIEGLTVAANGTVAFHAGTLDANLWATEVGASGRGSEPVRLTDDVSRNTHPDYSPNGLVAYMQTAVGSLPSVWMMRDDGTHRTPLIPGTNAGNPEWDRTSNRLLVVVHRDAPQGAQLSFAWVDAASRRLTDVPLPVKEMSMVAPRLSPDGSRIAYHHIEEDGTLTVWTTTLDGARTRVATDPEAVSYPAWSPDGRSLAVEIKRGDSTHVGVVPSAGGPVELLTSIRGQSWPHSWSADNDRIAFAGERGGVWNIYTVSRSTRAIAQVTSFTSAAGYVRYPAWSPTGSRIVFERATLDANVWTLALPPAPR